MSEIDRILGLPRHDYTPTAQGVLDVTRRHLLPGRQGALKRAQVSFLMALQDARSHGPMPSRSGARGVFGPVACGAGKTIALQLGAASATGRVLLVLPRRLVRQMHDDRGKWGRVFRFRDVALECPRGAVLPGQDARRLYYTTYAALQRPDGVGLLHTLRPDEILFDEFHLAAKVIFTRLWRYLSGYRGCRVSGVSGSFMGRSVMDYYYHQLVTLRDWSVLPLHKDVAEQWAAVLDLDGEPDKHAYQAIAPILPTFEAPTRENYQSAFAARLSSAPGVVIAGGPLGVGVSLSISLIHPRSVQSAPVREALHSLREDWVLPDGTEIVDTLEAWAAAQNLRLGFYRRWPTGALDEYADWFEARREWARWIHRGKAYLGFESAYFVQAAAMSGSFPRAGRQAYYEWTQIRHRGPAARETVWVDASMVQRYIDKWGSRNDTRSKEIIWYHSASALRWWFDRQRAAEGPPFSFAPAGVLPSGPTPLASIAHGTGWNGQQYSRALVLEPPAGPRAMEQLLARHHRDGQLNDVEFTFVGTQEDRKQWIDQAMSIHRNMTTPLRILIADWT